MNRFIWMLALLSCGPVVTPAAPQLPVTPSTIPFQTFVDGSGAPCAGCKISSYAAGTSTPLATYTDSTSNSQNTNPIVLDMAGGANIWVATNSAYKFVLVDALGSTVWTVDNVKGGGGGSLPCSTAYAINYSNNAATALTCDPTITIDPSSHAIEIGGTITGPYFSLHNVSAIPASWTFDVTTPASALASLGTLPYSLLPQQGADTLIMNATGGSATPTAVQLPAGCLFGVNYSNTTHSWTCIVPGGTPLNTLASQAADTVVMNATGAPASPTAVSMPTGCTTGITYNTITHSFSCITYTPLTCSGSTAPWTCYRIDSAGTIEQFGVILAATTSATLQTVDITFPFTFTTQEEMTVSGGSDADGADDAYVVFHRGITNTGATVVIRCALNIGGAGCGSISSAIPIHWHAMGK